MAAWRNSIILLSASFAYGTEWTYHAQYGQDRYVNEHFFHDLQEGVFIDIGAYDGVHISNTYFFEKELDWTGICVEPNPEAFDKLKKNRASLCIQGCVSDLVGEQPFFKISGYPEMLSGLVGKYDPQHLLRILEDILRNGGGVEEISVPCFSFNNLLERAAISHVHFLSIDTEGGEFDILSSIDFEKFQIDVIVVENNYNDPRYVPFMESKGFQLDSLHPPDMIFIPMTQENPVL